MTTCAILRAHRWMPSRYVGRKLYFNIFDWGCGSYVMHLFLDERMRNFDRNKKRHHGGRLQSSGAITFKWAKPWPNSGT